MAIVRVEKNKDYTTLSNYHFKDKVLSLKAIGLLSFMLSLPDNWDFSIEGLEKVLKDGRTSIANALKELEDNGFLVRNQLRNDSGSFSNVEYIVYEQPITDLPKAENPITVKPIAENQRQLNTKEENTNIYKYIVDYLNEKTNSKYKHTTPKTKSLINARLKEGFKVEDFEKVIDTKVNDWLEDSKMKNYLRPETLFGTKFEGYLNQSDSVSKKENHRRSF